MKVTTDGCLFGGWIAKLESRRPKSKTALDIGTGTGLLSLMLCQVNPEIVIDAIEIDKEAAEQAKENVNASPWKEKVNVINENISDLTLSSKYEIIISNPPFYENELKSASNKKNIAHHSDELPLNQLLTIISQHLTNTGTFYLLLPYKRKEEIQLLLNTHLLYPNNIVLVKQSTDHDYFRMMIAGGLQKTESKTTELSIRNGNQEYTREFIALLKDYYLFL